MHSVISSIMLLLCMSALPTAMADSETLKYLLSKTESHVLELAQTVEKLYMDRCNAPMDHCNFNNYETCLSELPNQQCITSDKISVEECNGCGAFFDYSASTVSLPEIVANGSDHNPTDNEVIETICFSRKLDEWFIQRHDADASYWSGKGVDSPQMYFGSSDGTMRIFPGRRRKVCGQYDPRTRPWYVAASSGPKNVILILDTSGSMSDQLLANLKTAASRVIATLTVADRVAIVQFSSKVNAITDEGNRVFVATEQNKVNLNQMINDFTADGGTNFYDAFDMAFDIMDASIENERAVSCISAILFFTDGKMTEPEGKDESDVIDLVMTRLADIEIKTEQPILLFTYSISNSEMDVHEFPKLLACSTNFGIWSMIDNKDNIVESLTSYYTLLTLGLGSDENKNFVAWVEPYQYATGGVLGTTVSAPVYDRSHKPPLFVGVVAFDFTLAAMDKVSGVNGRSNETLEYRIFHSTCQILNLTLCELEYFRQQGLAGSEAQCFPGNCTQSEFNKIKREKCPNVADYPELLWINIDNHDKDYEDAVCCPGDNMTLEQCLSTDISSAQPRKPHTVSHDSIPIKGVIITSSISGFIAAVMGAMFWWKRCRGGRGLDPSQFYQSFSINPGFHARVRDNPVTPPDQGSGSNYATSS